MLEELGAVAAESLDFVQTTSVDGRIYISTEDLLEIVHASIEALTISVADALVTISDEEHLFVVHERAEGMASSLAMFDAILHAAEDREGLESLSPGDFL